MIWEVDIQKLVTLRELKNLTAKDLSLAIGKTVRSYRNKEQGLFPFTANELCAIANVYGIDPRSFFSAHPRLERKTVLRGESPL